MKLVLEVRQLVELRTRIIFDCHFKIRNSPVDPREIQSRLVSEDHLFESKESGVAVFAVGIALYYLQCITLEQQQEGCI